MGVKLIGIRLDESDIKRLDYLCATLGLTRPKLIKNLVSGDEDIIKLIADKAMELKRRIYVAKDQLAMEEWSVQLDADEEQK